MLYRWKIEQVIDIWLKSVMDKSETIHKIGYRRGDNWICEYSLEDKSNKDRPSRIIGFHHPADSSLFPCDIFADDCIRVIMSLHDGASYIVGDVLNNSVSFTKPDLNRLTKMLEDPDAAIATYYEAYPKFESDDSSPYLSINVEEYEIKGNKDIVIRFRSGSKSMSDGLYVGFESLGKEDRPRAHIFKVTKKTVSLRRDHDNLAGYEAKFCGYIAPSEEAIESATFRWVVSKELINQAEKEACYL